MEGGGKVKVKRRFWWGSKEILRGWVSTSDSGMSGHSENSTGVHQELEQRGRRLAGI